jgi:hypothetical protein
MRVFFRDGLRYFSQVSVGMLVGEGERISRSLGDPLSRLVLHSTETGQTSRQARSYHRGDGWGVQIVRILHGP